MIIITSPPTNPKFKGSEIESGLQEADEGRFGLENLSWK